MIHTKEDLKRYLYADREAQPPHPNIILRHFDPIYRIKTLIRLCEYHFNLSSNSFYHKVAYYCRKLQLKRLEDRFCSEFAINVSDEGLVIWHPQRIIINPNAKVGKHCSISSGVVIAQAHNMCPTIGDNVELMIDCAVLGNIHIANNVRIGAKTLVIKTINAVNTTWAGIPAKKISDKGTIETPIPRPTAHL